jgi:hypothetical protein
VVGDSVLRGIPLKDVVRDRGGGGGEPREGRGRGEGRGGDYSQVLAWCRNSPSMGYDKDEKYRPMHHRATHWPRIREKKNAREL